MVWLTQQEQLNPKGNAADSRTAVQPFGDDMAYAWRVGGGAISAAHRGRIVGVDGGAWSVERGAWIVVWGGR